MSGIAARDLSGSLLGAYRVDALVGSGGMASVYRGFDTNLQREVAIKVLSAAVAAEPTAAPVGAAPAPPAPADGYAQLQPLLDAGIAAGKAGKDGEKLVEQLGEAQRAAASGDRQGATDSLRKLKAAILKGVAEGEVAPDFAQQILRAVDAIR